MVRLSISESFQDFFQCSPETQVFSEYSRRKLDCSGFAHSISSSLWWKRLLKKSAMCQCTAKLHWTQGCMCTNHASPFSIVAFIYYLYLHWEKFRYLYSLFKCHLAVFQHLLCCCRPLTASFYIFSDRKRTITRWPSDLSIAYCHYDALWSNIKIKI